MCCSGLVGRVGYSGAGGLRLKFCLHNFNIIINGICTKNGL